MAVMEGCVKPSGVFAIVEEGTQFSFSSWGDNNFLDGTRDMDIAIDGWRNGVAVNGSGVVWGTGAEKEIPTSLTSWLRLSEIGGIEVNMEDHITSMIWKNSIRMGGCIVQ
jgi:hypothetical protein